MDESPLFPSSYKHKALSGTNAIRILELLPGPRGTPIHVRLISASLDDNPVYEALSYEWGLPSRGTYQPKDVPNLVQITVTVKRFIFCDGESILITENLEAILQRLRYPDGQTRFLWIDGICINQDDVQERTSQVSLMTRIYGQASKALVWIGEEKADTEAAWMLIDELAYRYNQATEDANPTTSQRPRKVVIDDRVLDLVKGPYLAALTDLFTRSYFGRIWIVQEILLAKTAEVICGSHTIPWPDFWHAATVIVNLGLVVDVGKTEVRQRWIWHRLISIGELWEHRHALSGLWPSLPTPSLHALVELFLGNQVTDPRDRIYGMLGMVRPESQFGWDNPLQADYTKSIEDVYRSAFEWSLKDSQKLAMLDHCDAPATNKIYGFPTWIPDLTKGPKKCPLPRFDLLPSRSVGSLMSLFGDQFAFSINAKTLSVRGLIFDQVSFARSPTTQDGKHLVMMEQFHLFHDDQDPYPTGGSKLDALWRTFLCNYISTGDSMGEYEVAPASYRAHFTKCNSREFLNHLGLPGKLTGKEPDLYYMGDPDKFFSLHAMFPEDVRNNISILALMAKHRFIRFLYESLGGEGDGELWVAQIRGREVLCDGDEGRQFFVTRKGFMGLGPPCPPVQIDESGNALLPTGSGVRSADVVAVLAGSDKVWMLRSNGRGGYTIVGDAYVYGLTEGFCFNRGRLPRLGGLDLY